MSGEIYTGLRKLDDMTDGLKKGMVTAIAAPREMGKTALAISIMEYVAIGTKTVSLYCSLETEKDKLVQRILCSVSGLNPGKMNAGLFSQGDWPKLVGAASKAADAPIFIDDTSVVSPAELMEKVRQAQAKHNAEFIIVDRLDLIRDPGSSDNKAQEISGLVEEFKTFAKETGSHVLFTIGLPDQAPDRQNRRPVLKDLDEYRNIVNTCDNVFFIYREEYYEPTDQNKGDAEIIIAKHRQGPVGTVNAKFLSECVKFVDGTINR